MVVSVQVSCLMVFTVHGIVPPSCCIYFLGLRPWKYIHTTLARYNSIHCKNHDTTITCTCTCTCIWYTSLSQPSQVEDGFDLSYPHSLSGCLWWDSGKIQSQRNSSPKSLTHSPLVLQLRCQYTCILYLHVLAHLHVHVCYVCAEPRPCIALM